VSDNERCEVCGLLKWPLGSGTSRGRCIRDDEESSRRTRISEVTCYRLGFERMRKERDEAISAIKAEAAVCRGGEPSTNKSCRELRPTMTDQWCYACRLREALAVLKLPVSEAVK
jgi:hypothetical protein